MGIITLTTDFGNQDFYVGLLKGKLVSLNPHLNLIDITHQINPFDIPSAAFQVRTIMKEFPAGSIHVVLVNAFEQNTLIAAVPLYGQWLVVPDNRIASLIAQFPVQKGYTLKPNLNPGNYFSKIAQMVHALYEEKWDALEEVPLKPAQWFFPSISGNIMRGLIINVDRFGNCISNVHQDDFYKELKGSFEISIRNLRLRKIHQEYCQVDKGDAIAYFGMSGYLEFALRESNASALLGIKVFDQFTIEFYHD